MFTLKLCRGVTYDNLFVGRDPVKAEAGEKPGKAFQMGLPLRCVKPMLEALKIMTGEKTGEKKTAE